MIEGDLSGGYKYKDNLLCTIIRGLWDQQADSIIDVKIDDADAYSYKYEPMAALLAR